MIVVACRERHGGGVACAAPARGGLEECRCFQVISLRCYGAGARRATLWNAWRLRSAAIVSWSVIPSALKRPFWSSPGMNGARSLLMYDGGSVPAALSGMLVRDSGLVVQVIRGVQV